MNNREMELMTKWYDAKAIEPRLHDLELEVEAQRCKESHPEYWRRYEGWKRQLRQLTGFNARRPELRDIETYEAAHSYLLLVFERGNQ